MAQDPTKLALIIMQKSADKLEYTANRRVCAPIR